MCFGGGSRTSFGHCGRADLSATLPDAGWLSVLVHPHLGEVCPLSREMMLQSLSGRLQTGVRFLPDPLPAAPSACLAAHFPLREGYGLTMFRIDTPVGQVVPLDRWRVICGRGELSPMHLATYLLVQAFKHLTPP